MTSPRNSTTTSRGRTYKWRDESFVSVTTILSGGVPKPALKAWGEKLVAETAVAKRDVWAGMTTQEAVDWLKRAPFRETDRAAAQGTDVHDWCEKFVLGQAVKVTDEDEAKQPYLQAFLSWLAEWEPRYEMTEATVYNRRYGYAGTCDFLAWVRVDHLLASGLELTDWFDETFPINDAGEVLLLGDYKTGKGVYGETALQLAAYRHGEFIGLPDGTEHPMPDVAGCVVLHLTPDGYQLLPVRTSEAEHRAFLYAQQVRNFCEDTSKVVLGQPLPSRGALVAPRPIAPPHVAALVD